MTVTLASALDSAFNLSLRDALNAVIEGKDPTPFVDEMVAISLASEAVASGEAVSGE